VEDMADGRVVIDTELNSKGAEKDMSNLGSKLKKIGSTTAKGTVAAAGAATTAIVAMTKAAIDNYAEYEQLVGGVDTLFKKSSKEVQKYAAEAYRTAGLSANEYMETATGFSASLLQSLKGDTEKAAQYADVAITDMSDNANKMGTSMEFIQNAYQGFAKQNYTMLDNLKLGYGGTKEEMARLVKDASKIDKSIDANSMSFGNIVQAIHVMQKEMGIAGATLDESAGTIQGSVGMMSAAWQNLLTGMSNPNANFEKLMGDFVNSTLTVSKNITPVILRTVPQVVEGLVQLINQVAVILPGIIEQLIPVLFNGVGVLLTTVISMVPQLISMLPQLLECGIQLIMTLLTGLTQSTPLLISTIIDVVFQLVDMILLNLPLLVQAGLQLIVALGTGLIQAIPELIQKVPEILNGVINTIVSLLPMIIDAGILLFTSLVEELPTIIEAIVVAIPLIVDALVNFLTQHHTQMLEAGYKLFVALIKSMPQIILSLLSAMVRIRETILTSILEAVPKMAEAGFNLLKSLFSKIKNVASLAKEKAKEIVDALKKSISNKIDEFKTIGKQIIDGLWNGIKSMKDTITKNVSNLFGGIVDSAKKKLKIHSPSKVFYEIGQFIDMGAIGGIKSLLGRVKQTGEQLADVVYDSTNDEVSRRQINNAMLTNASALQSSVYSSAATTGNSYQTINIHQKISTPDEIAREMRLAGRYAI
jgi:phage-related protein